MPPRVTEEPDDTGAEAEPSLKSLLENILGENAGWADLDNASLGKLLKRQTDAQRQAMRKQALDFRVCFSTPEGRRVLDMLLGMTLRTTAWPVHLMTDAQMLMAHGIWREAQNSFVAAIVEAMAAADNQDIKPRGEP